MVDKHNIKQILANMDVDEDPLNKEIVTKGV